MPLSMNTECRFTRSYFGFPSLSLATVRSVDEAGVTVVVDWVDASNDVRLTEQRMTHAEAARYLEVVA